MKFLCDIVECALLDANDPFIALRDRRMLFFLGIETERRGHIGCIWIVIEFNRAPFLSDNRLHNRMFREAPPETLG